jgi:hypothetical protein
MNKQELKEQIKETDCTYSDATLDYLISKTTIQLVPIFTCNNVVKHTDISRYINYFFNQLEHQQLLINNKEVDTSSLLTKFKVGDVVYYFDKDRFTLIRGEITSIDNRVSLTQDMFKGPFAYSTVGIKRLNEVVDFVYECITNNDLFLTIDEAVESLINNTFRLEQKRKQEAYNNLVEEERLKFESHLSN